MWVEMMREAWEHLLSLSFAFMITLPDLSDIKFVVPVGVVAVHQILNWFSEFYAKTKHIGAGEKWRNEWSAEVGVCCQRSTMTEGDVSRTISYFVVCPSIVPGDR